MFESEAMVCSSILFVTCGKTNNITKLLQHKIYAREIIQFFPSPGSTRLLSGRQNDTVLQHVDVVD